MEQVELFPEEILEKRSYEQYEQEHVEEEYDDSELLLAESKEPRLEFSLNTEPNTPLPELNTPLPALNAEELLLLQEAVTPLPEPTNPKKWTKAQDQALSQAYALYPKRWTQIAQLIPGRTPLQCQLHWQNVLNPSVKKGQWTANEDANLLHAVGLYKQSWKHVAQQVPGRTIKQCRERWVNNLNPALINTPWTPDEDVILLDLVSQVGTQWSLIAKSLSGRSDSAIKYRHRTLIKQEISMF